MFNTIYKINFIDYISCNNKLIFMQIIFKKRKTYYIYKKISFYVIFIFKLSHLRG